MQPTITVDAKQALARFSEAGIPEQVRTNLRRLLPALGKAVGASVESKLDSQLKTRRTLTVTQQMRETRSILTISVALKSPSAGGLLPTYLEMGTRPHEIRGNPFLAFYWEKLGMNVVFRRVMHPGTKPYGFMETTMEQMQAEIVDTINQAVRGL